MDNFKQKRKRSDSDYCIRYDEMEFIDNMTKRNMKIPRISYKPENDISNILNNIENIQISDKK